LGVMEGGHYVVSELTILGDIDYLNRVPGHPFPIIPCDISLASVQLFQGSDNHVFTVSAVMDLQGTHSLSLEGDWEGGIPSAAMEYMVVRALKS